MAKPALVEPTKQQPIPGTEIRCSKKLNGMHERYAIAKYQAKIALETMAELKPEIVAAMQAESVPVMRIEIDVGDEQRTCVTELVESYKLKSKLEAQDEE
jgi:hypothetical protein